jgi:hypothetical protein
VFHDLGGRVDLSRKPARSPGAGSSHAVHDQQEHHVTRSPSHRGTSIRRTSLLGAVLLAAALTASACGGDDADATDKPTTRSTSASPTPSATPTPTPTEAPLSPFEAKPQVRALRAYMVAVGQALNSGDYAMHSVSGFTTSAGHQATLGAVDFDIKHRYNWPGPEPFTPTAVRSRGGSATVSTCIQTDGWSVNPKTGKTIGRRTIGAISFGMQKGGGRWRVDSITTGAGDCASVAVKEVRW